MVTFTARVPVEDTDSDGQADSVRVTSPALTGIETALADTAPAAVSHESSQMSLAGAATTPKFAAISGAASGNNTILGAVTGKKIRVVSMFFVCNAAVTVKFKSAEGGSDLTGAMSFAANGGISLPFNPVGWFETAAGELLNMVLGGAQQVSGGFTYIEV